VKALVHIVPRAGEAGSFERCIRQLAEELRAHPDAAGALVTPMLRLEGDPLGPRTPYRAALEISGEAATAAGIESLVSDLGERLAEVAHPDHSSMLVGEDVAFIPCERDAIRTSAMTPI